MAHSTGFRGAERRLVFRTALYALTVFAVSAGFESLFIHHGLNMMDEGWPLHAAMEMHEGKTLYDEVFWVFPPGHVLPAWIAYALDPPGLIGARVIYAAFSVAASVALFWLARSFMPVDFALLAGLLVAIAAPKSHWEQLLFGYRYIVWSVIALLCFYRRLRDDDSRWLLAAGLFAGIALVYRLTPAFAVSVAISIGIIAASGDWRRWLSEGLLYSAGLGVVLLPVLVWLQLTVGLEKAFIEIVVRPVEMTALQSQPMPPILLPNLRRIQISYAFGAFGFRLYLVLYVILGALLLARWADAMRRKRPFDQIHLLTFVLFGGIFFSRTLGRSDIPHLDSAIAPVAVLLAYCAYLAWTAFSSRWTVLQSKGRTARWIWIIGVFTIWGALNSADRFLDRDAMMGDRPLEILDGTIRVRDNSQALTLDRLVPEIQRRSKPEDPILVMSHAPILYVLSERKSPGYFDLMMPGTFRSEEEQALLIDRLERDPPAVVVMPRRPFDNMRSRGIRESAPLVTQWVVDHYRRAAQSVLFVITVPKDAPIESTSDPTRDGDS